MEKLKKLIDRLSLKKSLVLIFSVIIIIVTVVSSFTIFRLALVQEDIMNSREAVVKISNRKMPKSDFGYVISTDNMDVQWLPLTAEKKVIYYGSIIAMVAAPIICIILGAYLGSILYYNLKLKKPIALLRKGVESLMSYDLDFRLNYDKVDEMGDLCNCFDKMRKELRRSQYKVNKLNEDRKVLLASVAHDIRTPLMVIKGYTSFLNKKVNTDEETRDVILNMRSSIERLESYVECIRNVQNLDEIKVERKEISVQHIVHEMESNFQQLFQKTNLKYELNNECCDSCIVIDSKLLFRIIENIIGNSIRFAKTKVIITLKISDGFEIIVRDDGKGFPDEILKNAVKPFRKSADNTHWGMGLYISKLLTEKMNGKIVLTNEKQSGAMVKIKIPID